MASLSYVVYLLASLFNPIIFLLYGHHDHRGDQHSNSSSIEHSQYKVALFVFGDSPFEPGNYQYLPNVTVEDDEAIAWPYGMTFFHNPTGRFSDGRIVPDFIEKKSGIDEMRENCAKIGANWSFRQTEKKNCQCESTIVNANHGSGIQVP